MWILLSLLPLLCPVCGEEDLTSDYNYTFYSQGMLWKDAQTFCRRHHTDLATIRSQQTLSKSRDLYWTGLYRENAESPWKWSRGDVKANSIGWMLDPLPTVNCAVFHPGVWSFTGSYCNGSFPFMCFDEIMDQVENKTLEEANHTETLILVKESKTWEEALDHCRSLGGVDSNEYDLATLVTEPDYAYARERAQDATTDEVWTGLRFLAGHWFWVAGEPVQYGDIHSCPTGGSCGVLEKSGTAFFQISDCMERRNFLCYIKP